jgi:hypothetical protein
MRYKVASVTILLAVAAVAALAMAFQDGAQPASGQSKRPDPTTILARVRKAKANGAKEVTFPAPEVFYASVGSLDEALRYYDAVIAKPVEKTSFLIDSHNVSTFYKFEVVERLSGKRGQVKPLSLSLPAGLPPAGPNHFYLMTGGGNLTLEGVKVTVESDIGELSPSQNYLLLVRLDPSGSAGVVELGPYGVFKVSPDEAVESIATKPNLLKSDMESRYGNSVARLRAELQRKN